MAEWFMSEIYVEDVQSHPDVVRFFEEHYVDEAISVTVDDRVLVIDGVTITNDGDWFIVIGNSKYDSAELIVEYVRDKFDTGMDVWGQSAIWETF